MTKSYYMWQWTKAYSLFQKVQMFCGCGRHILKGYGENKLHLFLLQTCIKFKINMSQNKLISLPNCHFLKGGRDSVCSNRSDWFWDPTNCCHKVLVLQRSGSEASHPDPCSTKIKNWRMFVSSLTCTFMKLCLIEHWDNLTLPYCHYFAF